MSPVNVALCYGSAIVISLFLLWYFGSKPWYIHALSVGIALTMGAVPLSGYWATPAGNLSIGWAFLLLFVWGAVGPVMTLVNAARHYHQHHQVMHHSH